MYIDMDSRSFSPTRVYETVTQEMVLGLEQRAIMGDIGSILGMKELIGLVGDAEWYTFK